MVARRRISRAIAPFLALWLVLCLACSGSGKQGAAASIPAADTPAPLTEADLPSCIDLGADPPGLKISEPQVQAGIPCLRYRVELGNAPARGPEDAPVTLVMFSDFECPFCRKALKTVEALERQYAGKLRFVYKAFPIDRHPNAMTAALMAHSAQAQGNFWPFHDLLFSGRGLDRDTLMGHARQVGLDEAGLRRDLDELRYAPQVRADLRQARRLDVTSTPVFFVNGRRVKGAQSMEAFRAVIDEELEFAGDWRAAGVTDLYAHATQHGYDELRYADEAGQVDPDAIYAVPLEDSPAKGPADAPLTIVVFGDFQCPFCAKGHVTMKKLEQRYGDRIRLVYKFLPLPGHSLAIPAARASLAAHAQGKFWAFHDALYAERAKYTLNDLLRIARELGLDMAQFEADMQRPEYDEQIRRDLALAQSLGVTGTPAHFVNGRPIIGALPELEFRMLFAEELQRVEALRAQGVTGDRLYEALTSAPAP